MKYGIAFLTISLTSVVLADYSDYDNILQNLEYQDQQPLYDDYQTYGGFEAGDQLEDPEDIFVPVPQLQSEYPRDGGPSPSFAFEKSSGPKLGLQSPPVQQQQEPNSPSAAQQQQPQQQPSPARPNGNSVLPAYCDPPNPCPIGYTSKDGCIEDFENTSEFSRNYQAHQSCLCDSEHMFNCPMEEQERNSGEPSFPPFPHMDASADNPFLVGEKLHLAAKKGIGY